MRGHVMTHRAPSWRAVGSHASAWLLGCTRSRRLAVRAACQQQAAHPSPLDCSRSLAAARAAEAAAAEPLVADRYAPSLLSQGAQEPQLSSAADAALDAVVARFLDEQLLKASLLVNIERQQEYNQVVIVGDAMDTRAFRLPWPAGTVIYLVGAAEVHELAEAVLAAQEARVPRGCLLRRVDANLQSGDPAASFAAALERAGFRGDRLSVWALQGANRFELSEADVTAILTDASNLAAFDSLVLGELPPMKREGVENLLSSFGLLGAPLEWEAQPGGERLAERLEQVGAERPWLFIAHQKRLSLQQMGIYEEHTAAAEETDEDFFGNFS